MNTAALIELLPVAIALASDIATAIQQAHASGQDPTPDQVSAIQSRTDALNAQWEALIG